MIARNTCLILSLAVLFFTGDAFSHSNSGGHANVRKTGEAAHRDQRCPQCRERTAWKVRDARLFYLDGLALARRRYFPAAIESLERACDLAPKEGRYHLALGSALRRNGDTKGAAMHLQWAHEYGDGQVKEDAAELLSYLGRPPKTGKISAGKDRSTRESKAGADSRPKVKRPKTGSRNRKRKAAAKPKKSLHDRLGGEDAIKAVVEEFVTRVSEDDRVNSFFANANLTDLKARLVEQIGEASGGPQTYWGQDMKSAHAGMGINDAEFDAVVENLISALDKFKVPEREKTELLAVLGPMRKDIVER